MSYDPTREWTIAAADLTLPNNNFHWLYVKAPIDPAETTAVIVASETHIDALPEDGYIYYKIGFAPPVADGVRELHTLWGASRPGSGGGLADAPADGSKYARKDNAWVTVADGTDGAKPVQVTGLTLVSANWVADGSLKKYVLSHASITATSYVEVIPANASVAIVKAAEILPETDTSPGSVSIWATNTPGGDISVTINIYETA